MVLIQIESIISSSRLRFIATNEICAPLIPSQVICSKQLLSQLRNETSNNYETSNKKSTDRIKFLQNLMEHFYGKDLKKNI